MNGKTAKLLRKNAPSPQKYEYAKNIYHVFSHKERGMVTKELKELKELKEKNK
jgi:hypothetical protein